MPKDRIESEGLDIIVYRSKMDDKLVVDINVDGLHLKDCHTGGMPNIRIQVGDLYWELDQNGNWIGG